MNDNDEVEGVSELLTESGHSEAHSEASNIEHIPKRPVVDARGDHHEGDALEASEGSGRVVQEAQARTLPENWTSTPSEDPCRDAKKLQFSTILFEISVLCWRTTCGCLHTSVELLAHAFISSDS